jgi:hypothetical protein
VHTEPENPARDAAHEDLCHHQGATEADDR